MAKSRQVMPVPRRLTQDELLELLRAFAMSRFARLEVAVGSARLAVERACPPAARPAGSPPATACVVAPLLGIFQAGPEPGAYPFVQPGQEVGADVTVGLIWVLDDATVVKAGVHGTVAEVCVQDGQLVEFGQTLLRIRVAAGGSGEAESPPDGKARAGR